MTNRERIIETLRSRPVDRPPLAYWLGFAPWPQTLERWRRESGIADLDVERYFGLDRSFQVLDLEYGPYPHFPRETLEETDEYVVFRDWRGIVQRNNKASNSIPDFLDNPVHSRQDWEQYKRERLLGADLEARLARLPAQIQALGNVDAPIQAGCFPWGVFGTPRDVLGVENLLLDFYDDPQLVADMMQTHTHLWLRLYEAACEHVRIDHVHVWEDMSGKQGSLISVAMIHEFMGPCYDALHHFVRRHDVPIYSVDSDGYMEELVVALSQHGVNAFMPFEVQAGNDIEAVRREHPDIAIMGGLDKRAIADGQAPLHAELDRAERLLSMPGWFIGFDHLIPPDVPWENFRTFVTELSKMVGL
jgi:uroporphyrinogen decarboxylase